MTVRAEKVLAEALRLPPRARASIAGNLILSLDRGADEGAEDAWAQEVDRRLERFEADKKLALSWDDVKRSIDKARRGRHRA